MNLERVVSDILLSKPTILFFRDKGIHVKPPSVREYIELTGILGSPLYSLDISAENGPNAMIKILSIAAGIDVSVMAKDMSTNEIVIEFQKYINMVYCADYFAQVPKVSSKKDKKTESTGGHTFAGQIASFMEDLGMSLNEVLDTSYPLLLMLQHDKPRPDYTKDEDKVVEISGKEMAKRKNGNN